MKTTLGGFSLMPPENQASVGHAPTSPSPTSTDRLIFMRRSSAAAFSAEATARVRVGTFRSRILG
jgi:hypothetical protein